MYKFKFADIGEGLHEGVVGEIFKKVGDDVQEGDPLFSVETDKMASDIPSPVTGKVTKVLIESGKTVHVGDDTFYFEVEGGSADTSEEVKEAAASDDDNASVVGEVKVSNHLFNADALFGKKTATKISTPPKAKTPELNIPSSFDINSINPTGNGEKVDVVVIGAGPGGYTVAERLAEQGHKTVVIEKEFAGGVCLNVGCIPTKTLLKSSKVKSYIEKAEYYGVDIKGSAKAEVNWNKMQERKNKVSMQLRKGVEGLLKMVKAEFILGTAEVIDKHNVKVGDRTFTTKIIVLATGSKPIMLPLEGFDQAIKDGILIDSTGALSLESIPKKLVVVGGGVIGLEFAMLYHELGTEVTILEGGPNILGPMDGEVKKYALNLFREKGVDIKTNVKVVGHSKTDGIIYEEDGAKKSIKAEKVLLSIGRSVNNLGLDKSLGIKVSNRGAFIVNDHMQTSIPNIFAIGDVTGQVMLAHVAYKHSQILANFILGKHMKFDKHTVPACVYTHPEISSIGMTEEEIKEEGKDYIKVVWKNAHLGRVLAEGEDDKGFTKLLIEKKQGKILGAHIINANSSDMIAELALNMELEGTIYEVADTIHPHPSISEGIYEAAVQAVKMLKKQK